jgi:hypothetical protein
MPQRSNQALNGRILKFDSSAQQFGTCVAGFIEAVYAEVVALCS